LGGGCVVVVVVVIVGGVGIMLELECGLVVVAVGAVDIGELLAECDFLAGVAAFEPADGG